MVNIPLVIFIGGPTRHGRTVIIQGVWYPEISVYVITTVRVPLEEALSDIAIIAINVVIRMDCGGEASWVKLL